MRRNRRILAIMMAVVLFAISCMASRPAQKVYAGEIESDLSGEGLVEADVSRGTDDFRGEEDPGETENFEETKDWEESVEDTSGEAEDTSQESDFIRYEAEAEVFGSRFQETAVDLYYIEDAYQDKISLPSGYRSTYQVVLPDGVSGDVQYRVSGDSAEVDNHGIISPKIEIYYKNEAGGYWTTEYI